MLDSEWEVFRRCTSESLNYRIGVAKRRNAALPHLQPVLCKSCTLQAIGRTPPVQLYGPAIEKALSKPKNVAVRRPSACLSAHLSALLLCVHSPDLSPVCVACASNHFLH